MYKFCHLLKHAVSRNYMHIIILSGIVDPPEITNATAVCQGNMPKVQIEWNRPSTLLGVNISNYTIDVEGVESIANGNANQAVVNFPCVLHCQNQNICVSATTLAGMSELACDKVSLTESKNEILAIDVYVCIITV